MENYNARVKDLGYYVGTNFGEFIKKNKENGSLSELEDDIPAHEDCARNRWNMEKAKVVLKILNSKNRDEVDKILSFLDHTECGWQGGQYILCNQCLRFDRRCRKNYQVDNSPEMTEKVFSDMEDIFLNKEYGGMVTYLFGYCILALFSSRLKKECLRVPYLLQIACERNSGIYRLIHEIVHTCDINAGLFKNCHVDFDYGYCDCDHVTVFPSQIPNNILDSWSHYRDIPVVVDGYENEKYYNDLLRETANVPGKTKRLGVKDWLNVLPIFVCQNIKSSFRNVFSIDLTELDIEDEYMELLNRNKQRLASWVSELVIKADNYFEQRNTVIDKMQHRTEEERPFFDNISKHIEKLRKEYREYINLTVSDVTNIGYITYFFSRFMVVFRKSIRLSEGTEFKYRGEYGKHGLGEIINGIEKEVTDTLFELHNDCSPVLSNSVNISVECSDSKESKYIAKKGREYAKGIVKWYQSFGALIKILPDTEYKDGRYVFSIKLLPGVNKNLLGRYIDEVRRSIGVQFLFLDISASSIKLIASDRPLSENSLLKILESQEFKESKMDIPYAVGYDMMGEMVIADVAGFTHLLIGGTSGCGKSSAIHSLLMSIVYKQPADKVKLLLLDFGASRLNMFENVPHMLVPGKTVRDIAEGWQCMFKLQEDLERRLEILDSIDTRSYEKQLGRWPSIVCVIDEFPAFIRQSAEKKESGKLSAVIEDLLARARKVNIHLVLSAQDTTQSSIEIKNTNLAAGIAFRCTNWHTSKAIIGDTVATELSGKGAMYFKCDQFEGLKRLQGSYMLPEEIMDTLDAMDFGDSNFKGKYEKVIFEIDTIKKESQSDTAYASEGEEDRDEQLLVGIVEWIWKSKRENISNKQIKDNFKMGYDRANGFLRLLEGAEIVSAQRKGTKLGRTVDLEKAEDFLRGHGCLDDNEEGDLPQIQNGADAEPEPIPEENSITTVGPVDVQEAKDDNPVDITPLSEWIKRIKKDGNSVKTYSKHHKCRKRPAH